MAQTDELRLDVENGVARAVLDRPRALNAISRAMYDGLHRILRQWAEDPAISVVLVEGAGERAFCAGGDIRVLWEDGTGGNLSASRTLFGTEYTMNRFIHRYPKPYVALMDGITMGGGCGISVHGSHRVVTERTLLAMPETGIGFFPDVGASWFLSRCPGHIGVYLGLTGARLDAADAIWAGLADVFVPAEHLDELSRAIRSGMDPDSALAEFADDPGPSQLAQNHEVIDRCFAHEDVPAIMAAVVGEEGTWAKEAAKMLNTASPFSMAVALEAIRRGATMDIEETMAMEYRICRRFLLRDEFYEGIRAAVIDKDRNPRWIQDVDRAEIMACFEPLDGNEDLVFEDRR